MQISKQSLSAHSFEIDREPNTHYRNAAEFTVGVPALDVIVELAETSVRQLRDVLNDMLEEDDTTAGGSRQGAASRQLRGGGR